jgi:hypothetical protein
MSGPQYSAGLMICASHVFADCEGKYLVIRGMGDVKMEAKENEEWRKMEVV